MNTTHATFISRSNRWLAVPTLARPDLRHPADRRDSPGLGLDTIDGRGEWISGDRARDWAGELAEAARR